MPNQFYLLHTGRVSISGFASLVDIPAASFAAEL